MIKRILHLQRDNPNKVINPEILEISEVNKKFLNFIKEFSELSGLYSLPGYIFDSHHKTGMVLMEPNHSGNTPHNTFISTFKTIKIPLIIH